MFNEALNNDYSAKHLIVLAVFSMEDQMEKDSHTYLKRSLKVLGITNKILASLLTEARMDGQKTSESTISRWTRGATVPDAGVMLYLRLRLIELAKKMPPRPSYGNVVSVGGGKRGVGASVLSVGVAISLKNMGYKVLHVTTHTSCNNTILVREISSDIECKTINPADFQEKIEELKIRYDIIIVDLASSLMLESKINLALQSFLRCMDLLVMPLNISSPIEVWTTAETHEILDNIQCDNRLIVNFSRNVDVDCYLCREFFKQMEKWTHFLHPSAMIMVSGSPFVSHITSTPKVRFQSPDLEQRYFEFSESVLEHVGASFDIKSFEDMDFYDLVDRLD